MMSLTDMCVGCGRRKEALTPAQKQVKRRLLTIVGSLAFLSWPATAQTIGELESSRRGAAWRLAILSFLLGLVLTWLLMAMAKKLDQSPLVQSRPWILRWMVAFFVALTGVTLVIEGTLPPAQQAALTAAASGFLIVGAIRLFIHQPSRSGGRE